MHVSEGELKVVSETDIRKGKETKSESAEWNPLAILSPTNSQAQGDPPITCLTTTYPAGSNSRAFAFDTDSAPVGIDNRCSVCMSHIKSDFIGDLQEAQHAVTGFHGTKDYKVYRGTLQWRLEDDEGVVHDIRIPGSYYIPDGKHRLISPQHWSQMAQGRSSCLTLHDRAILKWKNGQATKTIPIDSQNIFTFYLAPGYHTFSAFCMQAKYDHGIHLGFSPLHARSVVLVLNPLTGYVYIVFDPTFDTVSGKDGNQVPRS
jgi:hypothetical protein